MGLPDSDIEVTAVMPCLNEARTVGTCVDKAMTAFRELGVNGEVVVADNGSADGSREIAYAHGARVIDVPHRGYGAALRKGIAAAQGTIIVMGDADDSYDWTAIAPLVDAVRTGADLVVGNRFQGAILPGAMPPLHRYVGNPVLSFVARRAFRAPIGDFHCGLRAFTPEAFRRMHVRTSGMEFATEMVARSLLAGLKVVEVPVNLYPDGRGRPPHLRSFPDGWRHLRFIATYAPDHLLLAPALISLAIGLLLTFLLGAGPVTIGPFSLGIHWLALGSMLTLTGLSLFVCGTLAKIAIQRTHPAVESRLASWATGRFRVEEGVLVGLASVVSGSVILLAVLLGFVAQGGGPSEATVHPSIAAATLIVAGVQIILGSFVVRLVAEESRGEGG
jgi:glycosyltransferase involved in cell wall biosynthesis